MKLVVDERLGVGMEVKEQEGMVEERNVFMAGEGEDDGIERVIRQARKVRSLLCEQWVGGVQMNTMLLSELEMKVDVFFTDSVSTLKYVQNRIGFQTFFANRLPAIGWFQRYGNNTRRLFS